MSRGLGRLQRSLLRALEQHGGEARLADLAASSAGLMDRLGAPLPPGCAPSRAQYAATARAVTALRWRGLVDTDFVGVAKRTLVWSRNPSGEARPSWRFTNPSTAVYVRLRVDTLQKAQKVVGTETPKRENV